MRILVLAGWVSRRPWGEGRMVAGVVRGLAERGHDVVLLADAVEDAGLFEPPGGPRPGAGSVIIRTMRHLEDNPSRATARLARFLARERTRTEHDVVLSLTRVAPGDVWMPIDFSAWAWLVHLRRSAPLTKVAMKFARHATMPAALLAERRAARRPGSERVRRVLVFDERAADEARWTWRSLAPRVETVGIASAIEPLPDSAAAAARGRIRAALHIDPARPVALLSAPWSISRKDPALRAIFTAAAGMGNSSPVILVLARDAVAVHRAAAAAGAENTVRIMMRTERMAEALAAADIAIAALTPAAGLFQGGSMGRYIADALRCGRPVIAAADAAGVQAVGEAGLVVQGWSVDAWRSALERVNDPAWLHTAQAAAAQAGRDVGFVRLLDRLDAALAEAAASPR